jgi:NADPH:quinone reductase-like Zn-dependent oxidoreductase
VKAILYRSYGSPDVLRIEEIEKPAPGDDELLIAVRAASVNPLDAHFMRGEPSVFRIAIGLRKPKNPRLGVDVAGRVEAVGKDVTRFKPGDEVFGVARGAIAEYVCGSASRFVTKPKSVTFAQAASVPVAGCTAFQGISKRGNIQPGQKILINGASGGVGTFAVQIAKTLGAHVTGVCGTRNVELVRSIGADDVIDYTRDDFTENVAGYDVLVDCVGNRSLSACRRVLKKDGIYIGVGAHGDSVIRLLVRLASTVLMSAFVSQKLRTLSAKADSETLAAIAGLMESGKVTPVIDKEYSLAQAADAIRHLETGHARGKLVITVSDA